MKTCMRGVVPRLTGLVFAIALLAAAVTIGTGAAASSRSVSAAIDAPDFGPNVKIFDPSMSTSEIKQTFDESPISRSRTNSARSVTPFSSCREPTVPPLPLSTSSSATTPR